ncbi:beta-ketoacyl-[acyl-carrier-protein] synthase family protein [Azospirillum sp. Sh1]|uniref:beta-ketoacyl-[acyl-carrier-protein] synthase family protein n=1 Tax=Azospirillum sp. Sh1 TaxID=2607285 RepID=UPI0011ECDB06|nr:beta-ketoacyl-[acyl-carrier-protein] synthase family protein [Azospirillum sp. Sh1]KAA0579980.1 beta-ketoacyl-[acyl-carrier-protein] synthase family protein [Azospirillum sp. Sh1]
MHPLSLSHMSIVSSLGAGQDATLDALRNGRGGLKPCRFETVTLDTHIGEVAGVDDTRLPPELASYDCRNNRLAEMALHQDGFAKAVAAARERYGADRIGVFLGTSTSGILSAELAFRARDPQTGALPATFSFATTHSTGSLADFVRRRLGLEGPAFVVSSACATTSKVFANAARMIATGLCDAAVVGGADSLCLTTLYGFHSLELVSPTPCRPFDAERSGVSLGEGAGFALLERADPKPVPGTIHLLGAGESNDAHHMSTPHPEGLGARLAMERALASAGLRPEDIDYVNLHGTATTYGDAAEDQAITGLLGTRTPVSSTKGYTGHTLGAAGIVEAIISVLALRTGLIPGSPQTRNLDPTLRSRYLQANENGRLDRVMTNSFGFGGSNSSLIFGWAA